MWKRYFIETARSAYANGGMGCGGWHPGPATAEIKVKADDGEQFYLSVSRFDYGICFYKTEESTFDNQIEEIHDAVLCKVAPNNHFSAPYTSKAAP